MIGILHWKTHQGDENDDEDVDENESLKNLFEGAMKYVQGSLDINGSIFHYANLKNFNTALFNNST